jgi:hypothetical protein
LGVRKDGALAKLWFERAANDGAPDVGEPRLADGGPGRQDRAEVA